MQFSDHPRGAFLTESDMKSYTLYLISYTVVASIKGSALATALYTYCQLRRLRASRRRSRLKPPAPNAVPHERHVIVRRNGSLNFRTCCLPAVGLQDRLYGLPAAVVGLGRTLAHVVWLARLQHHCKGAVNRGGAGGRCGCGGRLRAGGGAGGVLVLLGHGVNPYANALHM